MDDVFSRNNDKFDRYDHVISTPEHENEDTQILHVFCLILDKIYDFNFSIVNYRATPTFPSL